MQQNKDNTSSAFTSDDIERDQIWAELSAGLAEEGCGHFDFEHNYGMFLHGWHERKNLQSRRDTKLEQTIIERARAYSARVRVFYAKAEKTDEHDRNEFQNDHAALTALLVFGHLADCGVSPKGQAELLAIEDETAVAAPVFA